MQRSRSQTNRFLVIVGMGMKLLYEINVKTEICSAMQTQKKLFFLAMFREFRFDVNQT